MLTDSCSLNYNDLDVDVYYEYCQGPITINIYSVKLNGEDIYYSIPFEQIECWTEIIRGYHNEY